MAGPPRGPHPPLPIADAVPNPVPTPKPTAVPASAVRAVVEAGARKVRQGPLVREGLRVEAVDGFGYDADRYGTTLGELGTTAQFTAAVVVQR